MRAVLTKQSSTPAYLPLLSPANINSCAELQIHNVSSFTTKLPRSQDRHASDCCKVTCDDAMKATHIQVRHADHTTCSIISNQLQFVAGDLLTDCLTSVQCYSHLPCPCGVHVASSTGSGLSAASVPGRCIQFSLLTPHYKLTHHSALDNIYGRPHTHSTKSGAYASQ